MLTRPRLGLLCASLAFAIGGCGRDEDPAHWQKYECRESGFRAEMPGNPQKLPGGQGLEQHYTVEYCRGRRAVRVSFLPEVPEGVTPAERLLRLEKTLKAEAFQLAEPPAEGIAVAEATYRFSQAGRAYAARHRIYHGNGASYQVMAFAVEGEDAAEEFDRFLKSFAILPGGPERKE